MAGRQPIPTTLPAHAPRAYSIDDEVKAGREIRETRAKVPAEEWETWLQANHPDMLDRVTFWGIDLGRKWEYLLGKADDIDDADEQLIARCRLRIVAARAKRIEQGDCRAPETAAEQELLDRYDDMEAFQSAVRTRLGWAHGRPDNADPPRLRALAKRLRQRGLLPAIKREKIEEQPAKLSRVDRAWEKAQKYWADEIAEHGEELARRMWAVNKAARASNALAAARRNHLTDPLARLAFKRWEEGGVSPRDAVLSVTKEP
jgi:hypothetical protein